MYAAAEPDVVKSSYCVTAAGCARVSRKIVSPTKASSTHFVSALPSIKDNGDSLSEYTPPGLVASLTET